MSLPFKLIDVEIERFNLPLPFWSCPQPHHGALRNDNVREDGLSRCDSLMNGADRVTQHLRGQFAGTRCRMARHPARRAAQYVACRCAGGPFERTWGEIP